jgi:hypothetical protein
MGSRASDPYADARDDAQARPDAARAPAWERATMARRGLVGTTPAPDPNAAAGGRPRHLTTDCEIGLTPEPREPPGGRKIFDKRMHFVLDTRIFSSIIYIWYEGAVLSPPVVTR